MADHTLVDKMAAVWASIETLCTGLSEEEWKTPTDCPGWTVQDQLSHLAGNESSLLGRPAPQHEVGDLPHLRNAIGRMNEVVVDYRRSWPGDKVLDEFREVTRARLPGAGHRRRGGPGQGHREIGRPHRPADHGRRDVLGHRLRAVGPGHRVVRWSCSYRGPAGPGPARRRADELHDLSAEKPSS